MEGHFNTASIGDEVKEPIGRGRTPTIAGFKFTPASIGVFQRPFPCRFRPETTAMNAAENVLLDTKTIMLITYLILNERKVPEGLTEPGETYGNDFFARRIL
jgi:hypothetical protein